MPTLSPRDLARELAAGNRLQQACLRTVERHLAAGNLVVCKRFGRYYLDLEVRMVELRKLLREAGEAAVR
ncbi:MAG: hypothetical protein V2A73_11865 [Pseudomonadota bacterium]